MNILNKTKRLVFLTCFSILVFGAANAAVITPISVTTEVSVFGSEDALINGSGLNQVGDISTWTHTDLSGTLANMSFGVNFTPKPYDYDFDFDLGGTTELSNLHIWNYTNTGFDFYIDRDVTGIDIFTSVNGVDYDFFSSIDLLATANVTGGLELTQTFGLNAIASHVRLRITNSSGNPAHGQEVGLGEVRFSGVSAVPEPPVVLLLGLGFLMMVFKKKSLINQL